VPRTPRVSITDAKEPSDPTVNDDDSKAYDVGSRWINTVTGKVLFCVDNTIGAATWKDVSTPGAGSHPVHTDTVDPTVNDDSNAGYNVGDHWINTSTQAIFQAVDVSVGAAVWVDVSAAAPHPVTVSAVDPTPTDDINSGYAIGDHWINTVTQQIFQATDVSAGAAVWERIDGPLDNTTAIVDPDVDNDETEGYEVGSHWINTATGAVYVATDVTDGAAVWRSASNPGASPAINPGELMFGTLLDYPSGGNVTSGTVFYLRLKLSDGLVISHMRTFIDSGGSASRNLRMGLYSQTDPASASGVPNTRVAQTASVSTGGDDGTFKTVVLDGGNYTIPSTGFYWVAIVSDSTSLKFAVSAVARADFLPVRQEAGTGTTLPATTGTLTNPVSSVLYLAAVEA
jgi:hypothetical protein